MSEEDNDILILEPFYGGSHKQLVDLLMVELKRCTLLSLPDVKWHWRSRTSALWFSQQVPTDHRYKVLLCSSVLNLSELISLRADLRQLKKVVYFHENQLAYPVQNSQQRDFQFGYNQILTALVADVVVFNSQFNLSSFLFNLTPFLKSAPSPRPDAHRIQQLISDRAIVLHFPIQYPGIMVEPESHTEKSHINHVSSVDGSTSKRSRPVHIVWPHRWEHDKDPETFFQCLYDLHDSNLEFHISVIGQNYQQTPPIFAEAHSRLQSHILHWGFQKSKQEYYGVLRQADIVVSTSKHEFFGVAMLEATHLGCYPLCPDNLVYPEIFPAECLYKTRAQLCKRLRYYCRNPHMVEIQRPKINTEQYSWSALSKRFIQLLTP